MELQNFETEYLQDKSLLYFEDVDTRRNSSLHHIYMADSLDEIQHTLEELKLPEAKVYNLEMDSFDSK